MVPHPGPSLKGPPRYQKADTPVIVCAWSVTEANGMLRKSIKIVRRCIRNTVIFLPKCQMFHNWHPTIPLNNRSCQQKSKLFIAFIARHSRDTSLLDGQGGPANPAPQNILSLNQLIIGATVAFRTRHFIDQDVPLPNIRNSPEGLCRVLAFLSAYAARRMPVDSPLDD
jgi:hypothetical protein